MTRAQKAPGTAGLTSYLKKGRGGLLFKKRLVKTRPGCSRANSVRRREYTKNLPEKVRKLARNEKVEGWHSKRTGLKEEGNGTNGAAATKSGDRGGGGGCLSSGD